MNKWKILIIAILVLSFVILIASEVLFERPWSWFPWIGPFAMRRRMLSSAFEGRGVFQRLLALFATYLSIFLVGGLIIYLAPKRIHFMASSLRGGRRIFWQNALIGLLTTIVVIGLGILSALSAITFPVSFLVLMGVFVLVLMGTVSVSYELGREFFDRAGWKGLNPLLQLAFGILIIFSAVRIPLIGLIVLIVVVFASLGVAIATRFGSGRNWTLRPFMEDEV
jgi:hypothetical protein